MFTFLLFVTFSLAASNLHQGHLSAVYTVANLIVSKIIAHPQAEKEMLGWYIHNKVLCLDAANLDTESSAHVNNFFVKVLSDYTIVRGALSGPDYPTLETIMLMRHFLPPKMWKTSVYIDPQIERAWESFLLEAQGEKKDKRFENNLIKKVMSLLVYRMLQSMKKRPTLQACDELVESYINGEYQHIPLEEKSSILPVITGFPFVEGQDDLLKQTGQMISRVFCEPSAFVFVRVPWGVWWQSFLFPLVRDTASCGNRDVLQWRQIQEDWGSLANYLEEDVLYSKNLALLVHHPVSYKYAESTPQHLRSVWPLYVDVLKHRWVEWALTYPRFNWGRRQPRELPFKVDPRLVQEQNHYRKGVERKMCAAWQQAARSLNWKIYGFADWINKSILDALACKDKSESAVDSPDFLNLRDAILRRVLQQAYWDICVRSLGLVIECASGVLGDPDPIKMFSPGMQVLLLKRLAGGPQCFLPLEVCAEQMMSCYSSPQLALRNAYLMMKSLGTEDVEERFVNVCAVTQKLGKEKKGALHAKLKQASSGAVLLSKLAYESMQNSAINKISFKRIQQNVVVDDLIEFCTMKMDKHPNPHAFAQKVKDNLVTMIERAKTPYKVVREIQFGLEANLVMNMLDMPEGLSDTSFDFLDEVKTAEDWNRICERLRELLCPQLTFDEICYVTHYAHSRFLVQDLTVLWSGAEREKIQQYLASQYSPRVLKQKVL